MTSSLSMPKTVEIASPFHFGEQRVQERLGVRGIEAFARKVIRDYLPDQHRRFYTAQPFLILSARDEAGRPWATVLEGEDGFVSSPDTKTLTFDAQPNRGDALETAFTPGADVGILGIELATRRRNRVNGHVVEKTAVGITFEVEQSFGNCPQYIRERAYWRSPDEPSPALTTGSRLTASQIDWIGAADTFFIASGYRGEGNDPSFGMDASHRGGERGFVEVLDERHIRFPDYAGNNHYNTLGNLLVDPRAGFLFLDFSSGSLLQLTGTATIDWESADIEKFPGARRLVNFEINEIRELSSALRLRWQEDADSARSLRLVDKSQESEDVTSFVFEARDGGPLPSFEAGQHLPIELDIPEKKGKIQRTYSLSGAPNDSRYRISVKREANGLASTYLHDNLHVGTIIQSRKLAGGFPMNSATWPLVLVSAGIGITPMLSILHDVARQNIDRPVWFVHGTRDGSHHAFKEEVRRLAQNRSNIQVRTYYSRPKGADVHGSDYDQKGRISGKDLAALSGRPETQFLMCGPAAFMAEIKSDLEELSVSEDRIHYETF
ncbi:MAG: pyridoxamine 5'-phosphate oxidase family protein [Roseibium sp.]